MRSGDRVSTHWWVPWSAVWGCLGLLLCLGGIAVGTFCLGVPHLGPVWPWSLCALLALVFVYAGLRLVVVGPRLRVLSNFVWTTLKAADLGCVRIRDEASRGHFLHPWSRSCLLYARGRPPVDIMGVAGWVGVVVGLLRRNPAITVEADEAVARRLVQAASGPDGTARHTPTTGAAPTHR